MPASDLDLATPIGEEIYLTVNDETLVGGGGNDTFIASQAHLDRNDELSGGAGDDTLQLMSGGQFSIHQIKRLQSIETIRGSSEDDIIYLASGQIADVVSIDGGGGNDQIAIYGPTVNLVGKSITGFQSIYVSNALVTVDDKAMALAVTAGDTANDRLVFTGGTLSWEERRLIHRNGLETVEAKNAAGDITVSSSLLDVGALDGDRASFTGEAVALDAGRNATVETGLGLWLLAVNVREGGPQNGRFGIDISEGSGISLSKGLEDGSEVSVDGVRLGKIRTNEQNQWLEFKLDADTASAARVQKLVRTLTYSNKTDTITAPIEIDFYFTNELAYESYVTVTLVDPSFPINHAPERIDLSGGGVDEMAKKDTLVGTLSAQDPDTGDTFTYTLLDDANGRFALQGEKGEKLVVANSALLDYEQATSHSVRVKVTDAGGLSHEQNLTITVQDVFERPVPEPEQPREGEIIEGTSKKDRLIGTDGHDTLWGGNGDDRLWGGLGEDVLHGGRGKDTLTGSAGKDVFVFDTSLARSGTGIDTITDFTVKQDKIHLDNAIFKALGKKGSPESPIALSKKAFWKGTEAHDAWDRIIYDAKTGSLYYDPDGIGAQSAIKFAVLRNKPAKLSEKDFLIF
ncbi:cadherin domain-containing protein [Microvirga sp. 2MCAF38]|uniref:cadherin repeat domain-containing protein n=1 Tax=Microvirga sp. 2MCAF38 TaxID=3232989 RepID=UPI003F99A06C